VDMKSKTLGKTISLFIACLLLFPPLSVQPCQEVDLSQNTCCCCCCCQDSGSSLSNNDAEKDECPCQMSEKKQEESSPAIIFSYNDSRPETSLLTSKVEGSFEDYQSQLVGLSPHTIFLPSRDQPLYILHSSFLI
jgi:hypothetical protein